VLPAVTRGCWAPRIIRMRTPSRVHAVSAGGCCQVPHFLSVRISEVVGRADAMLQISAAARIVSANGPGSYFARIAITQGV
jgi:hypothetical protein